MPCLLFTVIDCLANFVYSVPYTPLDSSPSVPSDALAALPTRTTSCGWSSTRTRFVAAWSVALVRFTFYIPFRVQFLMQSVSIRDTVYQLDYRPDEVIVQEVHPQEQISEPHHHH